MNSTSRASGELPDDGDDMYTLQQYPILSIISSGNLKILELFFRHTGRNAIPGKAPAFQEPRFPPEHGMSRGLLSGKKDQPEGFPVTVTCQQSSVRQLP
jgi:hypothetical protein